MTFLKFSAKDCPSFRFQAYLSNGSVVFEDYITDLPSSWIRLKSYLKENNVKITKLCIVSGPASFFLDASDKSILFFANRQTAVMVDCYQNFQKGIGFLDKDGILQIT